MQKAEQRSVTDNTLSSRGVHLCCCSPYSITSPSPTPLARSLQDEQFVYLAPHSAAAAAVELNAPHTAIYHPPSLSPRSLALSPAPLHPTPVNSTMRPAPRVLVKVEQCQRRRIETRNRENSFQLSCQQTDATQCERLHHAALHALHKLYIRYHQFLMCCTLHYDCNTHTHTHSLSLSL